MSGWKWETHHPARRCGHNHCSDCKTRRGNNRGNRQERRIVQREIRRERNELGK